MTKKKKIFLIVVYALLGVILTVGSLALRVSVWIQDVYGVGFAEVIYTITSPLQGTGGGMVWVTIRDCLLPILPIPILYTVFVVFFAFRLPQKRPVLVPLRLFGKEFSWSPYKLTHIVVPILAVGILAGALIHAENSMGMLQYLRNGMTATDIYEKYYVDPNSVKVEAPKEKKNLILVYLESMETTYASKEEGGIQDVNYMPNMTQMAKDFISFSHSDKLGGFRMTGKTTWTMGALFATSSGLPFSFPVEGNSMGEQEFFAPGVTALGEILKKDGYDNYFLCGSDASFAGRDKFYQQHGDYSIYDLFTARKEGVIPEDYFEFWGFEDHILYEIAKKELTEISQKDQPFNFTMLTVDPHHTGGYVCKLCGTEHENDTANVIACADRQLQDFIDWCKEQTFFKDTVIVLMGDHPRMDTFLVGDTPRTERMMYNCFINAQVKPESATTNRECAPMDMFPTVLAAMGYEIEDNRLGLGTNLFSEKKTLTEIIGYELYNEELYKKSAYFEEKFQ